MANGLSLGKYQLISKFLYMFLSFCQFPSQIGAVLRSEILQHVLSFTKDPIAEARFQFWISETLQEGIIVTLVIFFSQSCGFTKSEIFLPYPF